jgi:cytochrome c
MKGAWLAFLFCLAAFDAIPLLVVSGPIAAAASSGDPQHGRQVFEKRCTGCHALEENREGPRLAGVYGRTAGSIAGFDYSNGLRKSGIRWDDTTLEKWLSGPDQVVPDAKMDFYVPKSEERRDLIAFFKGQQAAESKQPR